VANTKVIGITGNIGSGKSSVAKLLVNKGAALIDADEIARKATRDKKILEQISKQLGPELVKDGQLDRQKTADLIFSDDKARQKLNAIIHPWVRAESNKRIAELKGQENPPEIILQDIPLLYENSLQSTVDAVIVVYAPLLERIKRVQKRSDLSEQDIRARDGAQMNLISKMALADYVIDNSAGESELKKEVNRLWLELTES